MSDHLLREVKFKLVENAVACYDVVPRVNNIAQDALEAEKTVRVAVHAENKRHEAVECVDLIPLERDERSHCHVVSELQVLDLLSVATGRLFVEFCKINLR